MAYNKENPLRVFEAFGGYGSQSLALKRLKRDFPDFDYKVVGYSDIEPAAITAYMALHAGEGVENYGDISKIDWAQVPDFDLFTYSFPCTDISAAGQQQGLTKGSGTRSSLLWECERAIEAKRPKFLLMENVAALVQSKFIRDFKSWLEVLERFDYESFAKVMNAKDYGVPQNRDRVFCVSIRRDGEQPTFNWPNPFPLELRLKDVLEDEVDERYYLSDERIQGLLDSTEKEHERGNGFAYKPNDGGGYCKHNTNNDEPQDGHVFDGVMREMKLSTSQDSVVVNSNGLAPCHTAGHGNCPKVME